MTLWRVDVAGVSHRYVDAESKEQAVDVVKRSLLDAIDATATAAPPTIAKIYEGLPPRRRLSHLAALDGLTDPKGLRDAANARRRLARLIKFEREMREWAARQLADAPRPVDPERVARLLKQVELSRLEAVRARLEGPTSEHHGSF